MGILVFYHKQKSFFICKSTEDTAPYVSITFF